MTYMFVYGTLKTDGEYAHMLKGIEFVCHGYIKGRLYEMEYPATILSDNPREKVWGEVYRLPDNYDFTDLDEYEEVNAGLYNRVKTDVRMSAYRFDIKDVYVYTWNKDIDESKRIMNGMWRYRK